MRPLVNVIFIVALLSVSNTVGQGTVSNVIVKTLSGMVKGATFEESHAFYEIPYAKAPVGDLRFREPQPVEESDDVIDTSHNDYIVCHQTKKNCSEGRCFNNVKEDCLVLNVFVPVRVDLNDPGCPPEDRLPVFFYMHGGWFFLGAGTEQRHDGQWLSNVTNSVVVTINYRLGALGFLVYGDEEDGIAGNQGLKDQQLAMKWVQDNIFRFGGDKDRVTIAGNSAGGQSVLFHMVSPVSKPLFRRGIVMSGPHYEYPTKDEALKTTDLLLSELNCTREAVECLRNVPPQMFSEVLGGVQDRLFAGGGYSYAEPFRPFLGGEEFPDHPNQLFRDGHWHTDKEIMMGSTLQEATARDYKPVTGEIDRESFYRYNRNIWGQEMGDTVSKKYESMLEKGEDDYASVFGQQLADSLMTCATRAIARFAVQTSSRKESVFLYTSAYAPSGPSCEETNSIPDRCGTPYHASEISVLFRSGPSWGYTFGENDWAVADQFSTYWGSFFRTGSPSNGLEDPLRNVTVWPAYQGESWANIQIEAPMGEVVLDHSGEICDFWDGLDFYVPNSGRIPTLSLAVLLVMVTSSLTVP